MFERYTRCARSACALMPLIAITSSYVLLQSTVPPKYVWTEPCGS